MKGDGGPAGRMGQPGKTVEFYTSIVLTSISEMFVSYLFFSLPGV